MSPTLDLPQLTAAAVAWSNRTERRASRSSGRDTAPEPPDVRGRVEPA